MPSENVQRRLAAILAADVVGYSRLMGLDEAGTLARIKDIRTDIIEPLLDRHNGRLVKLMGDGFLIEFASVIDAVTCAVDAQKQLTEHESDKLPDERISLRIGINLGDIIIEDDDIYGDGVNIAARLEAMAEPGGICVSRNVRDQIRDKLSFELADLGEHEVKNIARPVRVFQVLRDGATASRITKESRPVANRAVMAGVVAAALVLVGGGWWFVQKDPFSILHSHVPPSRPSIAVMPFTNLSDDEDQAYFADGIGEDIATYLAKVDGLQVTPASAARKFRGRALDPTAIGDELGVAHILEGSVRRAGDELRVTAKLIDAENGQQLWAERYDRGAEDVFAIQDEIAVQVVGELSRRLTQGSLTAVKRGYKPKIEAYDLYILGRAKRIPPTPPNLDAALQMFQQAIEIDPLFAGGYAGASMVHVLRHHSLPESSMNSAQEIEEAARLAEKAVELDPAFGPAWLSLSEVQVRERQFDEALKSILKAMEAAPNDPLIQAYYGKLLGQIGRPEEGIEQIRQAMRQAPDSLPMLYLLGANQRVAGEFDEAIATLLEHRNRLAGRVIPAPTSQLIAAYMQAGKTDEARAEADALKAATPFFTVELASRTNVYKSDEDREDYLESLRAAGLPD